MTAGLIGGSIAAAYILKKLTESEQDHDDVLRETYEVLNSAARADYNLYVDHIDVDCDGNPREATPGDNHVPDLVLTSFVDNSLVVEVETNGSLDSEAFSQLEDFSKSGYTRVLVVPDDVVDDGAQFVEEYHDGDAEDIVVCGPSDITDLL